MKKMSREIAKIKKKKSRIITTKSVRFGLGTYTDCKK